MRYSIEGNHYQAHIDYPSCKEDLTVGDFILITVIQGHKVEMLAEVKVKLGNLIIINSVEILESGIIFLDENQDYELRANNDTYYKLELIDEGGFNTSHKNLIKYKKREFWTLEDGTILYPSQMNDEQLSNIYLYIDKRIHEMRKEIVQESKNALYRIGFRVPTNNDSHISDYDWAINNILIYKLLLDEISHRNLDTSVYDKEKPKKKSGYAKGKYKYSYSFSMS